MKLGKYNPKAYFSLSGIRLISDLLCFDMGVTGVSLMAKIINLGVKMSGMKKKYALPEEQSVTDN